MRFLPAILALLVMACSGGSSEAPLRSSVATPASVEYKLATIEEGGFVAEDDLRVARFRTLLTRLGVQCSTPTQLIADQAVFVRNHMADQGVALSMLAMMEYTYDLGTSDCSMAFATYAIAQD